MTEKEIDNTNDVLEFLAGVGVAFICVEFYGYNGSGQIDSITMKGLHDQAIADTFEVPQSVQDATGIKKDTLKGFVDEFADGVLSGVSYDWYNNEGGGGTLYIEVAAKRVYVKGFVNVIEDFSPIPSGQLDLPGANPRE